MIEINLLPAPLRAVRRVAAFPILSLVAVRRVLVTLLGLLLAAHLGLLGLGLACGRARVSWDRAWTALEPERRILDRVDGDLRRLRSRSALLETLVGDRVRWGRKLNELSDLVPPGLWFQGVRLDQRMVTEQVLVEPVPQKGPRSGTPRKGKAPPESRTVRRQVTVLTISGTAVMEAGEAAASVGRFIRILKEDPVFFGDFSAVELEGLERRELGGVEVVDFTLGLPMAMTAREAREGR